MSALDARVGIVNKTNDYFFVGPQLSVTSLKIKDNSRATFIELAPVLQFDLMSLLYEEVIKHKKY
ncbi:MAG: hypothetical protein EOO99_01090 [Pedobacter sp.]|nr:MAG: hypothetical protein EOO99_01090 [Pedobacter sp.]